MVDGLGLDDRRKAERRQEETRDGRQADLAAAAATRCVFGRVSRVALTLLALRLATVRFVKTNVFLKVRLLGEAGVAVHVGASERLLAGVLVANMVLQVVAAVERLVAMAFSPLAEESAPLFPAIQGLLGLDVRIRDMKPERFYIIECSRAIPKHSLVQILRNNFFFCFGGGGEQAHTPTGRQTIPEKLHASRWTLYGDQLVAVQETTRLRRTGGAGNRWITQRSKSLLAKVKQASVLLLRLVLAWPFASFHHDGRSGTLSWRWRSRTLFRNNTHICRRAVLTDSKRLQSDENTVDDTNQRNERPAQVKERHGTY